MLKLFTGVFAVAGLIAATGPIIIHLLNRRRFRVVDWAAMDFLRVALQRNRRVLQMRDLILLLLRVLCIAMFGLALARPYFSNLESGLALEYVLLACAVFVTFAGTLVCVLASQRRIRWVAGGLAAACALFAVLGAVEWLQQRTGDEGRQLTSRQPVHVVLLMDNSQSMAYESLEGSLLDQARNRAEELLDRLPADSRITVIPVCGSEVAFSLDAYRTRDDARDALNRIQVVDRGVSMSTVLELAAAACRQVPELPSKRVVLIGDQQVNNWVGGLPESSLKQIPELQVVQVAARQPENVWISDFHVQDGIADIETPA
ncbi:MAG: BatA domain-containing protein, partial [Planctomycetaceae bacterium]